MMIIWGSRMALFGRKHNNVDECTIWNVYGLKINPREDNEIYIKTKTKVIYGPNGVHCKLKVAQDYDKPPYPYFNEDENRSQLEGEFLDD